MVTRSDYLSNIVSHREYYAQYVSPVSINLVRSAFTIERLTKAQQSDENFNTIPLKEWDHVGIVLRTPQLNAQFKAREDCITQGALVCVLKESARQILKKRNVRIRKMPSRLEIGDLVFIFPYKGEEKHLIGEIILCANPDPIFNDYFNVSLIADKHSNWGIEGRVLQINNNREFIKTCIKDLVLYTHWIWKSPRFWELLKKGTQ